MERLSVACQSRWPMAYPAGSTERVLGCDDLGVHVRQTWPPTCTVGMVESEGTMNRSIQIWTLYSLRDPELGACGYYIWYESTEIVLILFCTSKAAMVAGQSLILYHARR